VLEELGIEERDAVLVLNKVDAVADRTELAPVLARYPNAIPISARSREGLGRLHAAVSDALSRSFADLDVETGVANGRMLAYLAAHGEVLGRSYADTDRVIVHVRIPQRHLGPLHEPDTRFWPHQSGPFAAASEAAALPTAIEDVA
jgi:GTP-binding protein HflX